MPGSKAKEIVARVWWPFAHKLTGSVVELNRSELTSFMRKRTLEQRRTVEAGGQVTVEKHPSGYHIIQPLYDRF